MTSPATWYCIVCGRSTGAGLQCLGCVVGAAKPQGPRDPMLPPQALREVAVSIGPAPVTIHVNEPGQRLVLEFRLPPRTSKNGTTLGIRQKQSFRDYRDRIRLALQGPKLSGELQELEGELDVAFAFYTDVRGDQADSFGLMQAIADILQGFCYRNDRQLRPRGRWLVESDHEHPHVVVTLARLAPDAA